jgi:alpha-tubulin suppressor-like RCC1 family protein
MGTVTLGEVKFTWQGSYSSSDTYYKQDIVEYNGDSYVCVLDGTNNVAPGNTNNWNLFAQGSGNVANVDGDIIYHNGSQLARLPIGSEGSILGVDPITRFPVWEQYRNLTSQATSLGGLPYTDNHSYRTGHCRMEDGTMRTWGDGGGYRLGDGVTSYDRSYPIIVPFPRGFTGVQKHQGHTYTIAGVDYEVFGTKYRKFGIMYGGCAFALDENQDLWTWGDNDYGHQGHGDTSIRYVPTNSSLNSNSSIFGEDIVHVAAPIGVEDYPSLAVLDAGGKVHTAGYNAYGQLGIGNTTNQSNFVEISPSLLGNVTWLTAGRERYTWYVAVKNDGKAYMWGYNGDYQTGTGDTTNRTSPQIYQYFVDNSIDIVFARCGHLCVFFIDSNGNLWHTGGSNYGSGGNGTNATGTSSPSYNQPQKVIDAATYGRVIDIQPSVYDYPHTLALLEDGTMMAAGQNNQGQLGIGNTTLQTTFVASNAGLPVDTRIKKLFAAGTANYGWSMALSTDGRAYTCGYNGNGALMVGDTSVRSSWTEVLHYKNILDIAPVGYTSEQGSMILSQFEI